MTLGDMLNSCGNSNYVCIYATNIYNENVCLYKGSVLEATNDIENIIPYLGKKVKWWHVINGIIVIIVKNFKHNKSLKTQYSEEYVKKWDRRKPETRPYRTFFEVLKEVREYAQKLKGTSDDK